MAIRKLSRYNYLEEIDFQPETLRTLRATGTEVQDLVTAARNDSVWRAYAPSEARKNKANQLMCFTGIGSVRAQEIIAAIDAAGFLLHESDQSRNARRLATAVFGDPQIFVEHYEELEDLSPEALEAVKKVIHEAVGGQALRIIEGYVEDGLQLTLEDYAIRSGLTKGKVQRLLFQSLASLRHQRRRLKLEVATCYSREALIERMTDLRQVIRDLQQEFDLLAEANPYPELQAEITSLK